MVHRVRSPTERAPASRINVIAKLYAALSLVGLTDLGSMFSLRARVGALHCDPSEGSKDLNDPSQCTAEHQKQAHARIQDTSCAIGLTSSVIAQKCERHSGESEYSGHFAMSPEKRQSFSLGIGVVSSSVLLAGLTADFSAPSSSPLIVALLNFCTFPPPRNPIMIAAMARMLISRRRLCGQERNANLKTP